MASQETSDKQTVHVYAKLLRSLISAGSGVSFVFMLTVADEVSFSSADFSYLSRVLPNLVLLQSMSENYLTENDFAAYRGCVSLAFLPNPCIKPDHPTIVQLFAGLQKLASNDSVSALIALCVAAEPDSPSITNAQDYTRDLTRAAMDAGADAFLLSCPDAAVTWRQLDTAVVSVDVWTERVLEVTKQAEESEAAIAEAEERHRRHLQLAMKKMVWKSPQTVFPHIPQVDPRLQERDDGVGQYTFIRTLGKGSFGTVQLARSPGSASEAVKVISKANIRSMNDLAHIERELSILLGILDHPNILRILSCMHGAKNLYIVMENLGDYNIETYAKLRQRDGKRDISLLPFPDIQSVMAQVIRGVAHCHSSQIAHRDLKMSNVMISTDGRITLIDFGLAVQVARGQMLHVPCGTIPYAPPEVMLASAQRGYEGCAADVWSVAVMLVELVCGINTVSSMLSITSNDSTDRIVEQTRILATGKGQEKILTMSGEDAYMTHGEDLRKVFKGVFELRADQRTTITDLAKLNVFSTMVGPLCEGTQKKGVRDRTNTKRLVEDRFHSSKVAVKGLARPVAQDAPKRLLEDIGGAKTISQAVHSAFDWLLPRPEFAQFFLACPMKPGRLRESMINYLLRLLSDPANCSKDELRSAHLPYNISDLLFNEFIDTLLQTFRMLGVRGELALEISRVFERLREPITMGYRTRLAATQANAPNLQEKFREAGIRAKGDQITAALVTSLKDDARMKTWQVQLPGDATLRAFIDTLLEGDFDGAASTFFSSAEARLIFRKGYTGFVVLFCDNLDRVLADTGILCSDTALLGLQHAGEMVISKCTLAMPANVSLERDTADWFERTLYEMCRGDSSLQYFAEMPGFKSKCLRAIFKIVSGQDTDKSFFASVRQAHGKVYLVDTRFNALLAHVDKMLRALFSFPEHPASLCNNMMRSLESYREDTLNGSTRRASRCQMAVLSSDNLIKPPMPSATTSNRSRPCPRGGRRTSSGPDTPTTVQQPLSERISGPLLERLKADERISSIFKKVSNEGWERMLSCITGVLTGSRTIGGNDMMVRNAHANRAIGHFHFDILQEHIAAVCAADGGQDLSDLVSPYLERFREHIVRSSSDCPVSHTVRRV
eukprot:TRINITY_DN28346_c0_g1_i1.p1 TRINITY_DN28346_c0_g1~~TRINITY_DN28346_c0_g1_i1.p1  ORF type:complete len:1169 (+),score=185.90 TRINITY_DN28346_c0_g1_i1:144-3509(+)